jgi:hypothetical protein
LGCRDGDAASCPVDQSERLERGEDRLALGTASFTRRDEPFRRTSDGLARGLVEHSTRDYTTRGPKSKVVGRGGLPAACGLIERAGGARELGTERLIAFCDQNPAKQLSPMMPGSGGGLDRRWPAYPDFQTSPWASVSYSVWAAPRTDSAYPEAHVVVLTGNSSLLDGVSRGR